MRAANGDEILGRDTSSLLVSKETLAVSVGDVQAFVSTLLLIQADFCMVLRLFICCKLNRLVFCAVSIGLVKG